MARTLKDKLAALSAERRRRVEARASELIAEEMSLRELRKALGHTQAKIAADLGVGQDTVSRYEQRSDMLLSTLREYVGKMGGELVLTAQFPNRKAIRLKGFADITGDARTVTQARAMARTAPTHSSRRAARATTRTRG
jgi:transcriptional regulator with XRE-family HTH domain